MVSTNLKKSKCRYQLTRPKSVGLDQIIADCKKQGSTSYFLRNYLVFA
jgi:hypothetical protein